MVSTGLTAGLAVKSVRLTISDFNFFPMSEGDSPLAIKRAKKPFDEPAILARDAAMRKAMTKVVSPEVNYKPPADRVINYQELGQFFQPLIKNALVEVNTTAQNQGVMGDALVAPGAVFGILMPIELVEYLTELYQVFSQLLNSRVALVSDDRNPNPDAYTGLIIFGESIDGEIVIAQTLLVQT
jgi:hypothetical protein